jgi:hypothetical protein
MPRITLSTLILHLLSYIFILRQKLSYRPDMICAQMNLRQDESANMTEDALYAVISA